MKKTDKILSKKGTTIILGVLVILICILFVLNHTYISEVDEPLESVQEDIKVLQEYKLIITANQSRPIIGDVTTALYACTNMDEVKALFEVYDFSTGVKKQLTDDFAGGVEVPRIETIEADEIGYRIDFETGEIHYSIIIRMYEKGQNLGRYTAFVTVNKDLEITHFRGF